MANARKEIRMRVIEPGDMTYRGACIANLSGDLWAFGQHSPFYRCIWIWHLALLVRKHCSRNEFRVGRRELFDGSSKE